MKKYKKGLLIGRFQPFHKGHLFLIKHIAKKVKQLIIGIGSANVYDEENPLTYEERKQMLEKVIQEEELGDVVEKIVPLNDYYNDELWFKNTLHKTDLIDVVIGNNEWPNRIFETRGYKIWRVGFFKKYLYEGVKIRELIHKKKQWSDRIPQYLVAPIQNILKKHKKIPYRFQHIALGGTFDHFHKGHQLLIDTALKYGNDISIGITTQAMHENKDASDGIELFDERKKSVTEYLKKKKSLKRVAFFPLSDIYGSTKNDGTIEAIVVSKSTYPNAIEINRLRAEKKLPELKIICIKDVKGTDGQIISSERIRRGEIDRNGKSCDLRLMIKDKRITYLILPEYLREELRKPLGKAIRGKENKLEETARKVIQSIDVSIHPMVIAVGDIIANSLEKVGFVPDVKIIDYRSRRQEISKPQKIGKSFPNKPGTISRKSAFAIKKTIESHLTTEKKETVIIEGEEDLLALLAILFAPLNSVVLYGQMDLGVVMVEATEEIKAHAKRILGKFEAKRVQ